VSSVAPWTTDDGQALKSHVIATQDPIPSFLTFLLPPHDPVVLRFFIADIGAPWLSKTLTAGIFWPRAF
jgi:hypothetical protein